MATRTATKQSAKQVTIDVLRNAGTPLHISEIAKRVLATPRTELNGKTPEATISAMLAVGSKPGGPFKRIDRGTYTLADSEAASTKKTVPRPDAKTQQPRTRRARTIKKSS